MPSFTITAATGPAARVVFAIGRRNGLRDVNGNLRDATVEEVTAECRDHLWRIVQQVERETPIIPVLVLT